MTVGAKTKGWKPVGKIKKGKLRMEEEIQRHVQKSIEEKKKKKSIEEIFCYVRGGQLC